MICSISPKNYFKYSYMNNILTYVYLYKLYLYNVYLDFIILVCPPKIRTEHIVKHKCHFTSILHLLICSSGSMEKFINPFNSLHLNYYPLFLENFPENGVREFRI